MKHLIILLLVSFQTFGFGQGGLIEFIKNAEDKGDKYFIDFAYSKALNAYQKAYQENQNNDRLELKIAESYRMLNQMAYAQEWYEKVVPEKEDVESKYLLHYAEALASQQRYEDAAKWYSKYGSTVESDSRAEKKIKGIENHNNLFKNAAKTTINKVSFNAEGSDFSPSFYGDSLVFVSGRKGKKKSELKYAWDESEFLDLYVVHNNDVCSLDEKLNSKLHEGPVVFFDNDNKAILTRNNLVEFKINSDKEGVSRLKLYYSERSNGVWSDPIPMAFNSDDYSVGHPAINSSGNILYFASDMPGGLGGVDLYRSEFKDGSWSNPVNLGENINTEGNEMFPYLHNDEELYFASNGHGGLGGLDIFGLDITKGYSDKLTNLGVPINSSYDDFGMAIRKDGLSGYFTSNRHGGGSQDDIYEFKSAMPLLVSYIVEGVVLNKQNKSPLPNAKVLLLDENRVVLASASTDDSGFYSFNIEKERSFFLAAMNEEFIPDSVSFVPIGDQSVWKKDIALMKDHEFGLIGKISDHKTNDPIEGVNVIVIDNFTGNELINGATEEDGTFQSEIADKILHDRVSYQIKLSKDGYLSKTLTFNGQLDNPGNIMLHQALDLTLDKIEIGTDIGKLIDIQPIYFDLGKSTIRLDAASELDKIVVIMQENPTIEIELGSHTDARGSASSNMRLSDKRAKASAEYIISKGISPDRIVGKGYGETDLINGCNDGIYCSEGEHQLNRRTEFKVTKF